MAADRVLAHFKRVNQADAEALLQALDRDDNADIARLAHRIKGACGFIGAAGLASACARLEKAARAGDGQAVTGLAGDFRTELERLNAYLDAR
ncbi:MAG: Hpt domain-containing protein [Lysobacteraceae bacterium]|nr:MAG: Hpt domain-containing protein [Xanthomonadaceae bacterium]